MHNNSDSMHEHYAGLDFSNAKPVAEIPLLAMLQAEHGGKNCGLVTVIEPPHPTPNSSPTHSP